MRPILTRRHFIASAAIALAAPTVLRATQEDWVLPPEYEPLTLSLQDAYVPGMILVDPDSFSLYFTLESNLAMRFVVGVGRGNLYEAGQFTVGAKKEWPSWTPTQDMIARNPDHYAQYADGMPGGPDNPLGARALYLFDEARGDTFLRIHGTPEPWTIASAVSNGCVRLVNEHIEMLYDMVQLGAPVVLYTKTTES
ncbi:L,D-transpeptidase [Gemmobacter fulvus]|uniref:L,D-transpeptidase n=1 Tax=Gemmobacter fulvus TaxID=2840474 RepID=A0A975P8I6_9RHOB|nr:L,D-transpeptidase [Gemmobacter fulvus]MBT9247251.1 L,D-transpeptidase [Gemmobacter fulvus]QWK91824.1 L,D-transpeptidase [Gemmobacter fulvus]